MFARPLHTSWDILCEQSVTAILVGLTGWITCWQDRFIGGSELFIGEIGQVKLVLVEIMQVIVRLNTGDEEMLLNVHKTQELCG